MDTDRALEKMRAILAQVEQFEVDLADADPSYAISDTWSTLRDFTDALAMDIARVEAGVDFDFDA